MSDRKHLDLLVDIAKLLKKYGPETFEILADNISKPEFAIDLANILSKTAIVSRTTKPDTKKTKAKRSGKTFRDSLIETMGSHPEKGEILIHLYDGLIAKIFLPSLRELNAYLSDNGLLTLKSKSRDKAIIPFVKVFLPMPLKEVKDNLQNLHPTSNINDSSLEQWSKVIFRKGEQAGRPESAG